MNNDYIEDNDYEVEEDNEPDQCYQCAGSGEGMYDGSTCRSCKGTGVEGYVKRRF